MENKGRLIIFEGGEKAGKSSQGERLAEMLKGKGYTVLLTHEPGGGDPQIRKKLFALNRDSPDLPQQELELVIEDRTLHYGNKVLPGLDTGSIVISDRGPASTLAYQGYGRGLPLEMIRKANKLATFGREADLTILLDITPDGASMRKNRGADQETRFEQENPDFHRALREGFLAEAALNPAKWVIVNADEAIGDVASAVQNAVSQRLGL